MNVFDCDSYSFWLLKGVDTEQLYMIELSHIETGDDWDMWDSVVAMEQTTQQEKARPYNEPCPFLM